MAAALAPAARLAPAHPDTAASSKRQLSAQLGASTTPEPNAADHHAPGTYLLADCSAARGSLGHHASVCSLRRRSVRTSHSCNSRILRRFALPITTKAAPPTGPPPPTPS